MTMSMNLQKKVHFLYAKNLPTKLLGYGLVTYLLTNNRRVFQISLASFLQFFKVSKRFSQVFLVFYSWTFQKDGEVV